MKYVLIGDGGHSKVISEIVLSNKENEILGYLDDKYDMTKVQNGLFYGPVFTARNIIECFTDVKFIIAIGNNLVRKTIAQKLELPNQFYATLIHKSAVISPRAEISSGSVVMPNAVINADAKIGRHVIINSGCIVEHDCKLDDYVHISPHSVLAGGVQIEQGACIGAGSSITPNVTVKEWAVIGAGATVISDIPSYQTAVGTPARIKKKAEVQ